MKKEEKIVVEEVFKSDSIDQRIKKLEELLMKLIKRNEVDSF